MAQADEVKRRTREQPAAHRARAKTVRGARTATAQEEKRARMQEGYDVYQRATGKKVGGGIGAEDRASRKAYHKWATSEAGKAAWKARKKPKPKPTPTPTPKPTNPINVTRPPKKKKPKPNPDRGKPFDEGRARNEGQQYTPAPKVKPAGPGVTTKDAGDALGMSDAEMAKKGVRTFRTRPKPATGQSGSTWGTEGSLREELKPPKKKKGPVAQYFATRERGER